MPHSSPLPSPSLPALIRHLLLGCLSSLLKCLLSPHTIPFPPCPSSQNTFIRLLSQRCTSFKDQRASKPLSYRRYHFAPVLFILVPRANRSNSCSSFGKLQTNRTISTSLHLFYATSCTIELLRGRSQGLPSSNLLHYPVHASYNKPFLTTPVPARKSE